MNLIKALNSILLAKNGKRLSILFKIIKSYLFISFQIIFQLITKRFFIVLYIELILNQMQEHPNPKPIIPINKPDFLNSYKLSINSGQNTYQRDLINHAVGNNSDHLDLKLKIIQIPFKNSIYILKQIIEGNQGKVDEKKLLQSLVSQIRPYIISTFESIVGVTYYTFVKKQVGNKQIQFKEYICLNLFLNMFWLLADLNLKISQLFRGNTKASNQQILKTVLVSMVELELKQLTQFFKQKFPQGDGYLDQDVTKQMKHNFWIIDRKDNEQHDLFIVQGIKYSWFKEVKQEQRSFKFILSVLQRIQQNSDQKNYLKFENFCKIIYKSRRQDHGIKFQDLQALDVLAQDITQVKIDKKIKAKLEGLFDVHPQTTKALFFKKISDMKGDNLKKLVPFQRVITKFIESLNQLIEDPKRYFQQRTYPYKDHDNNLVFPEKNINSKIYKNILLIGKNQQLKVIRESLFEFQINTIFNHMYPIQVILGRQADISTKIFKELMIESLNYLHKLIDLIIEAGNIQIDRIRDQNGQIKIKKQPYYINLVQLKIGDLFRAKMSCSPEEFTNILAFLYDIERPYQDSKWIEQNIFKIIKISDKIDKPERTALVNFLFQGRFICQVQVTTLKPTTSQGKLYDYCHMIYELNRGQFGVLSEIASIIVGNYIPNKDIFPFSCSNTEVQQYQKKFLKESNSQDDKQIQKFKNNLTKLMEFRGKGYNKHKPQWVQILFKPRYQPCKSVKIQVVKDILLNQNPQPDPQFVRYLYSSQELRQHSYSKQFLKPIKQFIGLQFLALTKNRITSIKWLSPILVSKKLRYIIIRDNLLTELEQISKYGSQSLLKIDLSNNQLGLNNQKPSIFQIIKFPNLIELLLNNNCLESFYTLLSNQTKMSRKFYHKSLQDHPLKLIDLSRNTIKQMAIYKTRKICLRIHDNPLNAKIHIEYPNMTASLRELIDSQGSFGVKIVENVNFD